ncbi:MAG: hypothetical protein LQ350_004949 [Teloschistes chrysophthalmus]|nr:MAG: hypothetical protein LQ350_004949 [Niorma chrysophthalma]
MIRSTLGPAVILLLSLLLRTHSALAAPNARPQTPEQQAQGEADLEADFLAQVSAYQRVDQAPTATTVSPEDLASESALLEYYATATFSDVPLPTGSAYYLDPTGSYNYELPKATDPCGPAKQDGTEFDTCTVDPDGQENINGSPYVWFSGEPSSYGVQCLPLPTHNSSNGFSNAPAFNSSTYVRNSTQCDIESFCAGMVTDNFPKNQWVWNTNGGPNCAVGMWMPAEEGAAKKPDKTRCMYGIYGTMALYCEDGVEDAQIAAVNLKRLPQGNGDTGEAVNAGYPSYLLAPYIFY